MDENDGCCMFSGGGNSEEFKHGSDGHIYWILEQWKWTSYVGRKLGEEREMI